MTAATRGLAGLRVKVFADGADRDEMLEAYGNPLVAGFTTNPTLLRRAGVVDYRAFAHEIVALIPDRPIFFEVLSDELDEMELEALEIGSWGPNVYVKVPVTNSRGEPTRRLLGRLAAAGVRLNVTALMTPAQVLAVSEPLVSGADCYLSVFAGRIADTGKDPVPLLAQVVESVRAHPNLRVIWASSREILNVFQADEAGCHAITATYDLLRKLDRVGMDLEALSLETIRMFHDDAVAAGLRLLPVAGPGRKPRA